MTPSHPAQPGASALAGRTLSPRQSRLETRAALLLLLLALGALVWNHQSESARALRNEEQRLAASTRMIELNIAQQLRTAHAALDALRQDLTTHPVPPGYAQAQLRTLRSAWPGARRIEWLDSQGMVVASSEPERSGVDASAGRLFAAAQAADAQLLMAGPARRADGSPGPGIKLALALPMPATGDASGPAAVGLLQAELDPLFFEALLKSANDRPGMWAALAHASGAVLAADPASPAVQRNDLAQPGTWFSRHLQSGQALTVHTGQPTLLAQPQLLAQRSVQLAELRPGDLLVVGVSRELRPILAPVQQRSRIYALLLGLTALAGAFGLRLLHRWRAQAAASEQREREQAKSQAEFLALALRGGNLGLWESDLRTHTGRSNERWYEMLGLQPGAIEASTAAWSTLIHPEDRERVLAAQAAHVRGETPAFEQRYRLRHSAGHYIWVLDRASIVKRDAAGQPLVMAGTHMDISATVAAEQALRDSESNLAVTLQSIGDAVIATDAQGRVTRLNPAAERLLGWPLDEARGRPLGEVFRIVNARTREPASDPVQQVLASGEVVGLANDTLLLARGGAEIQIADSAAPIRTEDGQVLGVVLVFSDVTEQYRVLQALREREQQLSTVSDAMPGPVARGDIHGRLNFVNAAFERWLGVQAADVVGQPLAQVLGADLMRWVGPLLERVHAGESLRMDVLLPTVAGPRHADLTLVPDRDAQGVVQGHFAVMHDISQRKQAEDALRLSERKARGLLAALHSGVVVHDAQTRVLDANPAACALLGLSLDQLRGVSALDARWHFIEEDGQRMPTERFPANQVRESGQAVRNLVLGVVRPDRAQAVWALCNAFPLLDEAGSLHEIVVTVLDITERQEAERRLLTLQAELSATLDAVPDLLFDIDLQGVIHSHHSPRHELLAAPPEQFTGQLMDQFIPAEAAAVVRAALQQAQAQGYSTGLQYELPLADGPHWFELSVSRKGGPAGGSPRFIVLARDISERKQAETERRTFERQLREVQKMESIGTLAGGIAHDFNNILAAILGNVALARDDLPDIAAAQSARNSLDQIQKASLRARALVQQILTFSRRRPQQLSVQPLRPVLDETLALLRATLPAGVQLQARLHDAPLLVRGDATQLQQVLMNLCTNAWQALPDGRGSVEVGLAPAEAPPGLDGPAGPCAHLWVRDDGLGMKPDLLERIFDPFFTTKPVGQGTGLGLSVVHGIVRSHGGKIQVESRPGQGSCFHLWLPLAPGEGEAAASGPGPTLGARGRGQAVLYVDDDEVMVLMVQRLLQRAGWQVDVCSTAALALAQLQAQLQPQSHYAALVTDFNMPGMSGLELARQVREQAPGLPIVISSGYLSDELREQARLLGIDALMKKENTLEELPGLLARLSVAAPAASSDAG